MGELNTVTSNLGYFSNLFADGWKQVSDIHNHPALHKHPAYDGSDLGPNLFPSSADTRYWDGTLKWGNKQAVITDGISSLEVSDEEFKSFHHQYFCSKYPEQYDCK